MQFKDLNFHNSIRSLCNSYKNIISSMTWLNVSVISAKDYFNKKWAGTIIEIPCTVIKDFIKIDSSILDLIENEVKDNNTSTFSESTINYERIFIIAVKDVLWEEDNFKALKNKDELQFLRHLRNASAHDGKFYFGAGEQRKKTLKKLPLTWRGKIIEEKMEGQSLESFFYPGDIFILLEDISKLIK